MSVSLGKSLLRACAKRIELRFFCRVSRGSGSWSYTRGARERCSREWSVERINDGEMEGGEENAMKFSKKGRDSCFDVIDLHVCSIVRDCRASVAWRIVVRGSESTIGSMLGKGAVNLRRFLPHKRERGADMVVVMRVWSDMPPPDMMFACNGIDEVYHRSSRRAV